MENFIVSARKYRPATFDTVVGQSSITTTLKNAIKSKHLAQSYLFCGPRGVGKTTCARILAKTINCSNLDANTEACNVCESCVSFNNNQTLNIFELDAASNNSVDDIRGLVEQVRFAPHQGKYKIYIIDEVHMLSNQAFNAFLKTLEEPPSYAIFILATTEKHKIIPTILSRCQIFDFSRITVDDIAKHLAFVAQSEHIIAEADALHVIAQKADGALRDALSIFDQIVSFAGNNITYKAAIENLNILDYDYYFKVTDEIVKGDISNALMTFNSILSNGFDGHNFIVGLSGHFRDLLVCRDAVTISLLEVSDNIKDKYLKQATECPPAFILQALDIANKCDINYKISKNQRLTVELALMKLCSINTMMEKKTEVGNTPPSPLKVQETPALTTKAEKAQAVETPQVKKEPVVAKAYNSITMVPAKPVVKAVVVEEKAEENNSFTQEDLLNVWHKFVQLMTTEKRMQLASTLSTNEPILKDNYSIEHAVTNKAQDEEFKKNKLELLAYLQKELKNTGINIETVIKEPDPSTKKAYTSKEKFKQMAEKNPALDELRKQLDLDIDY